MSGWYYRKQGMIEDTNEGPLTDQQFLQLAFDATINAKTLVVHPKHTKGQWVAAGAIPAAQQRFAEGERARASAKAEHDAAREQQRQEAARRKAEAEQQVAAAKAASPITPLIADGQPEATVSKIYARVAQLLIPGESIEYIAVTAKPLVIAPDCVAITNRRLIVFKQTVLGQMSFSDCLWLNIGNAHIKEGMMFSEFTASIANGGQLHLEYLPKAQARRLYQIAQQREEEAVETRRARAMEESRAGAQNIVVNSPTATTPTEDPIVKLTKLKTLLDQGLIEKDEYDATKAKILASM